MKWVFAGASTATPAEADLIKAYDYVYSSSSLSDVTTWKDLLTEYDGEDITYDVIGNPLAYRGAAMTWNGRSLASYSKNGTTITYSYDSSDMRTSKTVGGVKHNYYYVEGILMYEDCPSYKLFYTYDANGFLSGIKKVLSNGTTETFAVLCNMFGDVIGIYNSSKALVAKYTYDTWGNLLSITNASGADISSTDGIWTQNSIRYRGYVYDSETKLYYLQSRYYDPETCRFINADDTDILRLSPLDLTDKNLYSYCDCNPLTRIDTDGDCWMLVGAALGGLISSVSSIISQVDSGEEINLWVVGVNFVSGAISGAVATTSIGIGMSIAIGAALGGGTYIAEQIVKNEQISFINFTISTGIGAFGGLVSGKGADANTLQRTWDFASVNIERELRRQNTKYATKRITEYATQKVAIKFSAVISVFRYICSAISNFVLLRKVGD